MAVAVAHGPTSFECPNGYTRAEPPEPDGHGRSRECSRYKNNHSRVGE